MSDPIQLDEEVIASKEIYRGHIVNVRVDTVSLASGRAATREIVEHSEAVAIVPLDADGNVLLVRQYRLACEGVLLEIPAGSVDPGETPLEAAQRELQEETGHKAADMRYLTGFFVAPGYCTEYIHLYLATGLSPSQLDPDLDEALEPVRLPLADALALIRTNEIRDAKSIIGLLLAGMQAKSS